MARILFASGVYNPDYRYIASLPSFFSEVSKKHEIGYLAIYNKPYVEAQNEIAQFFLDGCYWDYLCLMEDDNWGHTPEMLESLLELNTPVASVNYFSRHFPYYSCLMRIVNPDKPSEKYAGYHDTEGTHSVDLSGFGMMLIKREVFEFLDEPYFRINSYGGPGCYATDQDFCDRLNEIGIQPMGCFDHCLGHRDVTYDKVRELQNEKMKEQRQLLLKRKGYGGVE